MLVSFKYSRSANDLVLHKINNKNSNLEQLMRHKTSFSNDEAANMLVKANELYYTPLTPG